MALVTRTFSDIITFTRASTGTFFNSSGVLTSAAINAPRFDYNPSTLAAQGLLIEEQRANSIRNNTMVGAVAGTPGTLPTNWQISNTGGLSSSVIGFGSEAGVNYVDIRVFGTTTAVLFTISPELGGTIAASNGQTWTASAFLRLVGGSTTNILGTELGWSEQNSTPSFLAFNVGVISIPTTGSLAANRVVRTGTNGQATTAFVRPVLNISFNIGVAIDFTLRIGLPQLELGAFVTSVIPTTTTALTRSADVAAVNTLNPWFNSTEGTLFSESQQAQDRTAGFPVVAGLSDSSGGVNCIEHIWTNLTSALVGNVVVGSSVQANIGASGLSRTTIQKLALAYKVNDFAASVGGGAVATDTSGTIPVVDRLVLGARPGSSLLLNGYLRRITYYPRRLSNAELQSLTS